MGKSLVVLLLIVCPSAYAQTDYPTLLGAHPTGVQRGQSTDVLVYTWRSNLEGAYTLLFDGDAGDFQTTILSDGKQGPLSVRLTVASNARAGIRQFRVATPQGVSSVASLVVGDEPGVLEIERDDDPKNAQSVTLPVTLYGRLHRPEKIDWYKFQVEAGDEVSFAVLASRLQFPVYYSYFVDPLLLLTDDKGHELATNDDYFAADPFLRYKFAKAGEYRIAIRDNRFRGEMPSPYQLTISRQPFLTNVFPLGVERGQEVKLRPTMADDPPRTLPSVAMRVPTDWTPGSHELGLMIDGHLSNPVPFVVSDLPTSQKLGLNDTLKTAELLAMNSGVNGWIHSSCNADWFRFDARKGETYLFEVFARRCQSDLDSILSVHDASGKELTVNDDTVLDRHDYMSLTTKDSRIVWTAPEDKTYYLRLTDVQGNGGPSFVYFLTCRVAQPDFVLRCLPDDKANLGPGCSTTWHLHLERLNGLKSPVRVEVQGLPPGVTASRLVFTEKTGEKTYRDHLNNPHLEQEGCLVLTAAPDAKVSAANVRVTGTATVKDAEGREITVVRDCRPLQGRHYQGPCRVNLHTVAVTNSSTLVVTPSATEARLTPGGSIRIDFELIRGTGLPADFKFVFGPEFSKLGIGNNMVGSDPFPPGIVVDLDKSKLRLAPTDTKGWLVLNAAPSAEPIADVPFSVMASAGTDGRRPVLYSTPAIYLTVSQPDP
jgi:hypothetical protein